VHFHSLWPDHVCATDYFLVVLQVDVSSIAQHQLRALSDPPAVPAQLLASVRTELPSQKATHSSSPKKDRRATSFRNVVSKVQQAHTRSTEQLPSPGPPAKPDRSTICAPARPAPIAAATQPELKSPVPSVKQTPTVLRAVQEVDVSEQDDVPPPTHTQEPLTVAPLARAAKLVTPQTSAKLSSSANTSLRIASLGDVVVGTVDKEPTIPRQPLKGRAPVSAGLSNSALTLSAEGLTGRTAQMQARKAPSLADMKTASPFVSSAQLPMSDDLDPSPGVSPNRRAGPRTMHVLLPSPPKEAAAQAGLREPPQDASDHEVDEDSDAGEPQPRVFALDPALAQVHMASVRGVKLNEELSKAGASRLLEQLRAKKEARAQYKC
jgi:hypothetical protein